MYAQVSLEFTPTLVQATTLSQKDGGAALCPFLVLREDGNPIQPWQSMTPHVEAGPPGPPSPHPPHPAPHPSPKVNWLDRNLMNYMNYIQAYPDIGGVPNVATLGGEQNETGPTRALHVLHNDACRRSEGADRS